jgi:hypothetical protein
MPVLATYTQQPADVLDYDVDFSEFFPVDDVVTAGVVTVTPPGLDLSYAIQGNRIKVWCSTGVDGTTYKVTVKATTSDSRVKEVEFKLKIKED